MESALSIKGQATIPKAVREHLQLGPGDRIKFFFHPDGSVVILPKIPTSSLKGIVKGIISSSRRRAPSIDEMHQAVVDSASVDAATVDAATIGSQRARRP